MIPCVFRDGDTALIIAAYKGHTAIVELLLQKENIDYNAKDK